MVTKTEQALKAFDQFITNWTPPAMHDDLFGHKANVADEVRRAILGRSSDSDGIHIVRSG